MWEQAEVTVVSRVIPVMLADLQELTPIHSSSCLSAGEGTHTDKCTQTGHAQLHFWPVTGSAVGSPTEKNLSVGHVAAFSLMLMKERTFLI